jgi:hypothetical protein
MQLSDHALWLTRPYSFRSSSVPSQLLPRVFHDDFLSDQLVHILPYPPLTGLRLRAPRILRRSWHLHQRCIHFHPISWRSIAHDSLVLVVRLITDELDRDIAERGNDKAALFIEEGLVAFEFKREAGGFVAYDVDDVACARD